MSDQDEGDEPSYRPPRVDLPGAPQQEPSGEPRSRGRIGRRGREGSVRAPREQGTRRKSRIDILVGIPLGILLGVGIVTAFVFLGSEGTIDAPRLDSQIGATGATGATGTTGVSRTTGPSGTPVASPAAPPKPAPPKLPAVVRISGEAPPETGGPKIEGAVGKPVRFRVLTDIPYTLDVLDTSSGQAEVILQSAVTSGQSVTFSFDRAGQYSLVVAGNDINVATFDIAR